jgi:Di-N-acetylchitobiase
MTGSLVLRNMLVAAAAAATVGAAAAVESAPTSLSPAAAAAVAWARDNLAPAPPCPCASPSLCDRVALPPRPEIFVFHVDDEQWPFYPLDTITTIADFTGSVDPQLVCEAHAHSVRVVGAAPLAKDQLHNQTYIQAFIQTLLQTAQSSFIDGVNFDFEDPLNGTNGDAQALTAAMLATSQALKAVFGPAFQVSSDVAWSPWSPVTHAGIDGRDYDYVGMYNAVDLLFVMAYDMRSQVFPPEACIASANTPFPLIDYGMLAFTSPQPDGLGLDPSKLVLGTAWYGYKYECQTFGNGTAPTPDQNICTIRSVPFRGAACSDAAGSEICYSQIMPLLRNNATRPYAWNGTLVSPFFNFLDETNGGAVTQVWFDDPRSLAVKYAYAKGQGFGGVGMWHVDCVDYQSADPVVQAETAAMWAAIATFRE